MLRTFESDWKRRHDALQWQLTEMEQQMVNIENRDSFKILFIQLNFL